VFRDELTNFFPGDNDAQRLRKQTFLLSEFLQKIDYSPPGLAGKALVHGHCHHKAILNFDAEKELLDKLGLDFEVLDSGCCGMAGAFGFQKGDTYEVSLKCGERVLLPRVREAAKDTLIITDGFSCHEQISQTTNRKALHLAQIIQMALHEHQLRLEGEYVEELATHYQESNGIKPLPVAALIGLGALAAGGALLWLKGRKD
jgi:Fe-S oxidoreductase